MQGDSAPEAFILEIQPFTPVFRVRKSIFQPSQRSSPGTYSTNGRSQTNYHTDITPISRDISLISGPSGHSPSAESLLLGAGDAHFVDGQALESPANGVGQQRNHVRHGGGPCGAVASDRQNAVAQVDGVGVARVFVTDHLVPMILHLRDFQMRRPRTLRCDHVEDIADRRGSRPGLPKFSHACRARSSRSL